MDSKSKLVKILYQNQTVSGEVIATQLGVSRNMVWKSINGLIADGFDICSSAKGYTLNAFPPHLTAEEIYCKTSEDFFDIKMFDSLPSTNAYCHDNVENFEKNTLVIARSQQSGKGRLDRNFYSPQGGLYLSFCFKQSLDISYAPHLTLFTAVAVCKAIEEVCSLKVGIKWVNDLFLEDKKVCGILSEATLSCEDKKINRFIIGIGLNTNVLSFPPELENVATSIAIFTKKSVNNAVIVAKIIENMAKLPTEITKKSCLKEYKKRCFILGKTVYLQGNPVTCLDVAKDCALVVKDGKKTKKLYAGEVSVKL